MNKICLNFLLITGISLYSFSSNANDNPYLTPEQVVNLANTPRIKVENIANHATKPEIVGLNKSFDRIYAHLKKNTDSNLNISDDILNAPNTPEAVAKKMNAIVGNTKKPEDFIHLMEPLPPEEDTTTENTQPEQPSDDVSSVSASEDTKTEKTTGSVKELIVEEDDGGTKHIYRRKVFVKQ